MHCPGLAERGGDLATYSFESPRDRPDSSVREERELAVKLAVFGGLARGGGFGRMSVRDGNVA